ncbi:hypothetical protein KM043_012389 [Ampulex compressa]|nr:hypothetical protein KM043_012389 [Ampulex compressa]
MYNQLKHEIQNNLKMIYYGGIYNKLDFTVSKNTSYGWATTALEFEHVNENDNSGNSSNSEKEEEEEREQDNTKNEVINKKKNKKSNTMENKSGEEYKKPKNVSI